MSGTIDHCDILSNLGHSHVNTQTHTHDLYFRKYLVLTWKSFTENIIWASVVQLGTIVKYWMF